MRSRLPGIRASTPLPWNRSGRLDHALPAATDRVRARVHGTLDQGPGFWKGVLSLWLNTQDIPNGFAQKENKAQPYFHRAKAAALLTLLDREAPSSLQRAALQAQLIQVYAGYGQDAVVLKEGAAFLDAFPNAPERLPVALTIADADARQKNTSAEFARYDRLLAELAQQTSNMPLTSAALASQPPPPGSSGDLPMQSGTGDGVTASDANDASATGSLGDEESPNATPKPAAAAAFELDTGPPAPAPNPAATAYAQVLDRYLGRLTATGHLPQALTVLRRELDRNPNDPRLYERLADFLGQNDLSTQQEELYRTAVATFPDRIWYDKLARLYLREKRRESFASLTRQVSDIFSGTDLDAYFGHVDQGGPQLFLELNLWFYDTARYGEWRLLSPSTAFDADDMVPADLERALTPENLLILAQTEAEGRRTDAALIDITHALELAPQSVEAYDERGCCFGRVEGNRRPLPHGAPRSMCFIPSSSMERCLQVSGPASTVSRPGRSRWSASTNSSRR